MFVCVFSGSHWNAMWKYRQALMNQCRRELHDYSKFNCEVQAWHRHVIVTDSEKINWKWSFSFKKLLQVVIHNSDLCCKKWDSVNIVCWWLQLLLNIVVISFRWTTVCSCSIVAGIPNDHSLLISSPVMVMFWKWRWHYFSGCRCLALRCPLQGMPHLVMLCFTLD